MRGPGWGGLVQRSIAEPVTGLNCYQGFLYLSAGLFAMMGC